MINRLILIVSLFVLGACGSVQKIIKEGRDLNIQEIYVQKIVPGLQESPPVTELHIAIQNNTERTYRLDSIYYKNKVYMLPLNTNRIKINLENGSEIIEKKYECINDSVAFLFYSNESIPYFTRYPNVYKRETVFMP